jgi:hypothetical protein
MRFRLSHLFVLTLVAAMLTGAWQHRQLMLRDRENTKKLQTLLRENGNLTQSSILNAHRLAELQAERRIMNARCQSYEAELDYWRRDSAKRGAVHSARKSPAG